MVRGPRLVREPLFDPGAELWPRGGRTDRSRRQAPSVLTIGGLPSPAADSDQVDSHSPDRANRLGGSVLSFTSNALGRRDPGGLNAEAREEWPLPGRGRSLGLGLLRVCVEEANVCGQPNVLQIRSHVSNVGDRSPASSSRYSRMLTPSLLHGCSTDHPARRRSCSSIVGSIAMSAAYGRVVRERVRSRGTRRPAASRPIEWLRDWRSREVPSTS